MLKPLYQMKDLFFSSQVTSSLERRELIAIGKGRRDHPLVEQMAENYSISSLMSR